MFYKQNLLNMVTTVHKGINYSVTVTRLSALSCSVIFAFFLFSGGVAQEDSLAPTGTGTLSDSVSENSSVAPADSLSSSGENVQTESNTENSSVAQEDSQKEVPEKKKEIKSDGLTNIVLGNKRIRVYGWGEYRVGGRCLCCDNRNDGDCIIVHNIERTDRLRLTKLTDGEIEGDTSDTRSYFGDINKRDVAEPVNYLMADIALGKMYEVRKVVVYTMVNKEKHTNYLSNCEFGYYDQFNRLQWTGKVVNKKYNEPITFKLANPVLTKAIMLRAKGGKSRITEVAIFCESTKE